MQVDRSRRRIEPLDSKRSPAGSDFHRRAESGEIVAIDARLIAVDKLRIEVRDRGPGIPEEERQRIFDMFYSVERGDRGRNGTGLGLAICRGMIGAHGGDVEALPDVDGQGTVMRITLPLIDAAPPRQQ